MTAKDSTREIAALTPHVRGKTLSFGLQPGAPLESVVPTQWDKQPDGELRPTLSAVTTGSIDTVVVAGELERMPDPLACLREWRRILREGGTMAMALRACGTSDENVRHTFTPGYLVALINRLGGFNVTVIDEVEPGVSWILVAERSYVAEIRGPLGTIGADLAGLARERLDARAELYFQIGTVFLQAGDPEQAEASFKNMLMIESDSTNGMFGVGMSYAGQGRWQEAKAELQRVVDLEPSNEDAGRWLQLATERASQGTVPSTKPVEKATQRAGSLRL